MTWYTGIMTLQPTNQPKTKAAGLYRHQLAMLILALPIFTLGTLAVVMNKYVNAKSHFVTWHGVSCFPVYFRVTVQRSYPLIRLRG
jgi:cytochrome b-561 domain containing protein 2